MSPFQGDVWLADLGLSAKTRPVIIVSRNDDEPPRDLFVYVPCTTQNRVSKYEVVLAKYHFLTDQSIANVQGIGSLPGPRLIRRLGRLNDVDFKSILNAILFLFNIPDEGK